MKNLIKLGLLIATIIVLDQWSKYFIRTHFSYHESLSVINGFFNITYVRNPGAAFGFLAEAHESIRKPLFLFLPVVACFWLVWLIWTHREKSVYLAITYSLILAGAVGNLIDRFTFGYVVDFLDFHLKGAHFPAFNVADSSISVAAGLLILDFIREYKKNGAQKTGKGDPTGSSS